ncbi:MAG: VWA domain-containing protein [Eubacteriales bacterium]|nr:VWA domain-containing protein [Eubacteriales bacterium]
MRSEDLQEAIQHVDEDLTRGARRRKPRVGLIATIAASAAAVLLAVAIVPTLSPALNPTGSPVPGVDPTAAPGPTSHVYLDGVIGERNPSSDSSGGSFFDGIISAIKGGEKSVRTGDEPMPAPMPPGEAVDGGRDGYSGAYNGQISAGTLTAGQWRDRDAWEAWLELVEEHKWTCFNLHTERRVAVRVIDETGAACYNVPVRLLAGETVLFSARTDVTGRADLFVCVDGKEITLDRCTVEIAGEPYCGLLDEPMKRTTVNGKDSFELTAVCAPTEDVKQLDLMLMVDTTGSMGDELEYLKAELIDIVSRVAEKNEALSIRVSVNFYRDEGDDYVVKYFDFRTDVNECLEQIKAQRSNGGGDWPEAVHTALDNAIAGHQWRSEAVKLCYLVLDAPPHPENEVQGVQASLLKSLTAAADQGIRIVPVLCSCYEKDTEGFCRIVALLTGGTYVYLTNDSGVGYDHLDPSVEAVEVEKLNDCLVRITAEYCGLLDPKPNPTADPQNPRPTATPAPYDEPVMDTADKG